MQRQAKAHRSVSCANSSWRLAHHRGRECMDMPGSPSRNGSSLSNLRLAISQKAQGITGDQHSPWTRVANTPGEMLGVGKRWADSVGQTRDAWSNINAPVNKGQPN